MDNSKYFYRTAVFTQQNNQVSLADIEQPDKISPLEGWMGVVISLADGEHTVQQLIDYMTQQYPEPPANIQETLHSVIERLEEGDLLKLCDEKVTLPYYLASPIEQLDLDKARQLIQDDGYNDRVN